MSYLDWHYFYMFRRMLVLWRNTTLFPLYYFCVGHHLSTLFSPWKRQKVHTKPGFHPTDLFYSITFNIFSSILAFILRVFVITAGIFLSILLSIIVLPLPIIWGFIPFLTYPFYLNRKKPNTQVAQELLEKADKDVAKLLDLLLQSKQGQFTVNHLGLTLNDFKELRKEKTAMDWDVFTRLLGIGQKTNEHKATPADLFYCLSLAFSAFKKFLKNKNIKNEELFDACLWWDKIQGLKESALIFDLDRMKGMPGVGLDWTYGYTVELDKYCEDINKQISRFPILFGREKEMQEIERTLLKSQGNNCMIIGEPGVSKHIIIETLAHRLFMGRCQKVLAHKRILNLNLSAVASSKPTILEAKGFLEELLYEAAAAGNVILVIDEIDKYIASGEGKIDFSDIFAKIGQSSVGLIGITTPENYHKCIANNHMLATMFEKITIDEPSPQTIIDELLISVVPVLETRYGVTITYQAIDKTAQDAKRFISSAPFPAKAIELLDESILLMRTKSAEKILLPKHIDAMISEKFHISLGEMNKDEKEKLINMEDILHQQVINQNQAIHVISAAMRRRRLEVASPNKPIGSFLFLGPTGVGKTETAKALANVYFGDKERMVRFDMSQYQKEEGLERLIGSVKLGSPGELTTQLTDRPFSLLLFDEFEKADKSIFNLFLPLLDEGYITDYQNKKIDARNTIIIATSNAGGEYIRECTNKGMNGPDLQKELLDYVQREKIYSPELLNRFDSVVVFTPLSEGHLREVAKLLLMDLNKRLADKEISINISQDLIKKLALLGFDPSFGARAMKRAISEKIEDQLAQKLLAGAIEKGEEVNIDL